MFAAAMEKVNTMMTKAIIHNSTNVDNAREIMKNNVFVKSINFNNISEEENVILKYVLSFLTSDDCPRVAVTDSRKANEIADRMCDYLEVEPIHGYCNYKESDDLSDNVKNILDGFRSFFETGENNDTNNQYHDEKDVDTKCEIVAKDDDVVITDLDDSVIEEDINDMDDIDIDNIIDNSENVVPFIKNALENMCKELSKVYNISYNKTKDDVKAYINGLLAKNRKAPIFKDVEIMNSSTVDELSKYINGHEKWIFDIIKNLRDNIPDFSNKKKYIRKPVDPLIFSNPVK